MDDALITQIDQINNALEESFGPMQIEASAQTIEESILDMRKSMSASASAALMRAAEESATQEEANDDPWFQTIVRYFMTLKETRNSLKYGFLTSQTEQMMERTLSLKNTLPSMVRSRIESISENLASCMDVIPESFKANLPIESIKRFQ
jgi:hypothetical protein